MRRFGRYAILGAACLGLLAGCAGRSTTRPAAFSQNQGPALPAATAVPGDVTLAWHSLPEADAAEAELADAAPGPYRTFSPADCQCRAAAQSAAANVLAQERRLVLATRTDHRGCLTATGALEADLLQVRSVEERNKASGAALELLYALAEIELQRPLLGRTLAEVERLESYAQELLAQGLPQALDKEEIVRQRLALVARAAELDSSAQQAQAQLRRLLGLPDDAREPVAPAVELAIGVPVDVEAAVQEGIPHRPDIAAVLVLRARLSADTLTATGQGLSLASPAPAEKRILARFFGSDTDECACRIRQAQLAEAHRDRLATARAEIAQAAHELNLRRQQAAFEHARWESLDRQAASLAQKHTTAMATAFEVTSGKAKALEAEMTALHAVAAWHTAEIRLHQAQGLLAAQCGYALPAACSR